MRIFTRRGAIAVVVGLAIVAAGSVWAVRRAQLAYHIDQVERWAAEDEPAGRLDDIERLADTYPNSAALQYWLAVAYRRTGKLHLVEAPLKRARDLGWSRRDITRQRYLTVFLGGDFRESEPYLQELVTSGVSDDVAEEVYEVLAKGYLAGMRLHEAKQCLERWIEWRPDTPRARLWLAEIFRVMYDDIGEEAQYRAIVKANPHHFDGRMRLATFLVLMTRIDEAEQEYMKACELRPDSAPALIGLAECQQRLARVEEAHRTLERAMALPMDDSQRGFALTTLGQILLRERKTAEAVKVLREATETFPNDHGTWYALGQALAQAGDKDAATRSLDRSKEVARNNAEIQQLYLDVIEKPTDAEARFKLASALKKYGQAKNAAGFYRSVLEIVPHHGPAHAALADYYAAVGRDDLAESHRREESEEGSGKDSGVGGQGSGQNAPDTESASEDGLPGRP